ncbi:Fic family protein [Corynebacterium diphtheriae]
MLKAIIAAKEKLAELRTACQLIPNPEILTSTIPLREARASTEIENIVTTNDELFRAAWNVDAEPTPATKEALRYNAALHAGLESIGQRPLSAKTTQIVCGTLQSDEPHIAPFRSYPGTFIGNPHTQQRIYTPPEGREVIEQHLSRWERYIYSEHDVDSLVKMALLHYQFEAIPRLPTVTDAQGVSSMCCICCKKPCFRSLCFIYPAISWRTRRNIIVA